MLRNCCNQVSLSRIITLGCFDCAYVYSELVHLRETMALPCHHTQVTLLYQLEPLAVLTFTQDNMC